MPDARHSPFLTITTQKEGRFIKIVISDNGRGIPAENMDKIFNPFFTTREVGKGTGLGLSICHGIITSHDGTIEVESKQGEGTSIIIRLPFIESGCNPPGSLQ